MKQALLSAIAALLLVAAPAFAMDWSAAAAKMMASSVEIKDKSGQTYCTGFVIDNERDFVLTADHCMHEANGADSAAVVEGKNAWEIQGDGLFDYAVLNIPGIDKPALRPPTKPLKTGNQVGSFGFGAGINPGMFRTAYVAAAKMVLFKMPGTFVVYDTTFIGGMSGGPIVDTNGRVVGMVQFDIMSRGLVIAGGGRSMVDIYEATKDFWSKR